MDIDIQLDKWKNLWLERQIWIYRGMNKDIIIWKERQMDKWKERQIDKWKERLIYKWMERKLDGRKID